MNTITVFDRSEVIVMGLPDGLSGADVPIEFVGLVDHIDDFGRVHVITYGEAPNDFTRCVFLKRKAQ